MRHTCLALVFVALGAPVARSEDEPDYLARLKELSAGGPLEKSPKAREYLKSLTKDQTLTALRQLGKVIAVKTPLEEWPYAGLSVMILMEFYAEPSGRLSDEAFQKLVAGIANKQESDFFRYALAMQADGEYSRHFDEKQRERLLSTCLTVFHDRGSPPIVRGESAAVVTNIFLSAYKAIIYSDDVVTKVQRTGAPKERQDLVSLIDTGKIKLTAATSDRLVPWRGRIQEFRKDLESSHKDEREPEILKRRVKAYTIWLDRLPLLNAPEPDSKAPKG